MRQLHFGPRDKAAARITLSNVKAEEAKNEAIAIDRQKILQEEVWKKNYTKNTGKKWVKWPFDFSNIFQHIHLIIVTKQQQKSQY